MDRIKRTKQMVPIARALIAIAFFVCAALCAGAARPAAPRAIADGPDHKLTYAADDQGNRVPDFSSCGYLGGGVPIPDAPVRVVVPPAAGDNTARIQAAIEYVASLPPDEHGLRGAVLLQKGRYEVAGGLKIAASGIVLRGQGMGEGGTVVLAAGKDRRTLISVIGQDTVQVDPKPVAITDPYVPVGVERFTVAGAPGFKAGDTVLVRRPSTAEWVKAVGMQDVGGGIGLGWKPGTRDVLWERTVTAVDGNAITVDAPVTTALDANFGGGTIAHLARPGRVTQVGVEALRLESAFDASRPKDEDHAWMAVSMRDAADAWVRQVTAVHFVDSAVALLDGCRHVTVEDCESLVPVSEIAAYRRDAFFTSGQQTLFQRCWSEDGRHDFAAGFGAAGPNAFVQCETNRSLDDSGPIDSWVSGLLLDNVRIDGNALTFANRTYQAQQSGWAAANCVAWQCDASVITCDKPPTANNWAIGCWAIFSGDGYWAEENGSVKPVSLYYGQLAERLGAAPPDLARMMIRSTNEASNPKPEEAVRIAAASTQPAPELNQWIDDAPRRTPIPKDAGAAKTLEELGLPRAEAAPPHGHRMAVENGWLTCDGKVLTGGKQGIKWWAGGVRPYDLDPKTMEPNPTRFVPGRIGFGLTDDLGQDVAEMIAHNRAYLDFHYGLWYDTRDADHERVRRMDGGVWPPFYELPFARSGAGLAWDGLSKYDLTKYNPWYWSRLKRFADLGEENGLVLFHQNYFQHNILEAGAHWASSPWRTANNINDTDFPEPPPYAGDKRIFMAPQFYDETNPHRRPLHQAYIRQCLDNFAENTNVVQLTSAEFSGPTHFVQFWLDTVADWERKTGKKPIIALSAPRDVQDAILADPARAAVVSAIDIRYWWYPAKGDEYAPPGDKDLTPRQWQRIYKPGAPSPESAFRAVREYRQKFPDKAVFLEPEDGGLPNGWAVLMGGGSLPNLANVDPKLLAAAAQMKPVDVPNAPKGQWALGDPNHGYLVYSASKDAPLIDLPAGAGKYNQHWYDPKSGKMSDSPNVVGGQGPVKFKAPGYAPYVFWLSPP